MKKTKILLSAVIAMLCFSSVNVNADSLAKKYGEKRVSFLDLLKDNEECKDGKCKHNKNKGEEKKEDKRKDEEKQETRDKKDEKNNKSLENVDPNKNIQDKEIEE